MDIENRLEEQFNSIKNKVILPNSSFDKIKINNKKSFYKNYKIILPTLFLVSILSISFVIYNFSEDSFSKKNTTGKITQHSSASFAYAGIIKWNNNIYLSTEEMVSTIEYQVGTIEYYSDNEQADKYDNFSNQYPIGTKIYKIKDINTDDAVAIKVDNEYIKAVREKK